MNSTRVRLRRPRPLALLAASALAATFGACQSIRTDADAIAPERLQSPAVYAWLDAPPALPGSIAPADDATERFGPARRIAVGDDELLEQVRAAAARGLTSRGWNADEAQRPRYVVVPRVWVELETETRDPLYSAPVKARYEVGRVAVDVYDADTAERLWGGWATCRLRDVALGYGVEVVRFATTDERRQWRIEEKVAALLERFPVKKR